MNEMLRIVIADDHAVVRLGVQAALEGAGIGKMVAEASSPETLFEALKATDCDVLITDFSMPGENQTDGVRMLAYLRRRYPKMPIVVVTMVASVAMARAILALGKIGVVEKLASMEELPTAVQQVCEGHTYVSASMRERLARRPTLRGKTTLSPREYEVVRLFAEGVAVSDIAAQFNRSPATVSRQKGDAMRKLGISNDVELIDYARTNGLANGPGFNLSDKD